jgi:monoamine oxidase
MRTKAITPEKLERVREVLAQINQPLPDVAASERRFAETVKWARGIWRHKRTRRCNAAYPAFIMARVADAAWGVRYARAFAEAGQ